ncbi:hypothetical protein F5Y19DRAFT_455269, partial [Xylariaceae sp. FL1651]
MHSAIINLLLHCAALANHYIRISPYLYPDVDHGSQPRRGRLLVHLVHSSLIFINDDVVDQCLMLYFLLMLSSCLVIEA